MTPQEELSIKHARVVEFLDEQGLDGVLLTRRCNFSWYTGGGQNYVNMAAEPGVATLLVTLDGATCLSANIESGRMADEELAGLGIESVGYAWHDGSAAAAAAAEAIGSRHVAADEPLPFFPDRVKPMPGGFDALRWSLTAAEVERYRALGRDVSEVFESTLTGDACRAGDPEYAWAAAVTGGLRARDIRTWVCLVAADERIANYRHPIPTHRPVRNVVLVAACGERGGLICSITRIVSFRPVNDELARKQQAVCTVDAAMFESTRTGTTLGNVWDATVRAYDEVGFADQWRFHHQGGSTGYLTRDAKALPGSTVPIFDHQAFAWNPSITGTKSEDTILTVGEGTEVLTAPLHWPTLDVKTARGTLARPDILVR